MFLDKIGNLVVRSSKNSSQEHTGGFRGYLILVGMMILSFSGYVAVNRFFDNRLNINPRSACEGCNIVVVDIDMLNMAAFDCIDNYQNTPNLCQFMNSSVNFVNNISHSDLTVTSFVSANTSLYPISHGVWNALYPLGQEYVYMQQVLKLNGYHTVIAGHTNTDQLVLDGFDRVIDSRYVNNLDIKGTLDQVYVLEKPFYMYVYADDMHFPYLLESEELDNDSNKPEGFPKNRQEYEDAFSDYIFNNYQDVFTEDAITENKELFSFSNDNKKALYDLYWYYNTDKSRMTRYLLDSFGPYRNTILQFIDLNNPDDIKFLRNNYLAILSLLDTKFSELMNYLEEKNLLINTIVVIRSDHGEEFMEHGIFIHENDLYQELIHTPLIIKVPGIDPVDVTGLTQDIDVMPTILELVGVTIPTQSQGESLVPMMNDPSVTIRDYQIAQKGAEDYVASFRRGDWKIIIEERVPIGLYNLDADPEEKNNLIEVREDIASELYDQYYAAVDSLPRYGSGESPLPTFIDPQKRQRLKDEGYF